MSEDRSDLARRLVAGRKRVTVACEACGRAATGYPGIRWCSEACRMRSYRQRRARDQQTGQQTGG